MGRRLEAGGHGYENRNENGDGSGNVDGNGNRSGTGIGLLTQHGRLSGDGGAYGIILHSATIVSIFLGSEGVTVLGWMEDLNEQIAHDLLRWLLHTGTDIVGQSKYAFNHL